MRCEPATGDDLPAVRDLLTACGLPVDDVREAPGTTQFVCRIEGRLAGTVGVDVRGDWALVRSLAVAPDHRGRGLGRRLTAAAERRAAAAGARSLVLLTTGADALAVACGFTKTSRCSLGDQVAVFRQFAAACCADAACYVKHLEPRSGETT